METKNASVLFYLYYSAVVFRHGLREANCVSRDKSRNRKEKARPHFYHKSSYSRVLPTLTTDLCCAFSPLFPYPLSSPRSDVGFSPPSVSFREHDNEEERGRTSAVLFLCCLYTILFLILSPPFPPPSSETLGLIQAFGERNEGYFAYGEGRLERREERERREGKRPLPKAIFYAEGQGFSRGRRRRKEGGKGNISSGARWKLGNGWDPKFVARIREKRGRKERGERDDKRGLLLSIIQFSTFLDPFRREVGRVPLSLPFAVRRFPSLRDRVMS